MRAALGVRRFNCANGVAIGVPKACAQRPATVLAAFTDTCWPRTARTASSKPSKAPATPPPPPFPPPRRAQTRAPPQLEAVEAPAPPKPGEPAHGAFKPRILQQQ